MRILEGNIDYRVEEGIKPFVKIPKRGPHIYPRFLDMYPNVVFACVKKGDKWKAKHVNRLYQMVRLKHKQPYPFVCLTDDASDLNPNICAIPLQHDLDGVFSKMELFDPDIIAPGVTVVYFDLDVVLQHSIDGIEFWAPENEKIRLIKCYWKDVPEKEIGFHEDPHRAYNHDWNSSVMTWHQGKMTVSLFNWFMKHREEFMTRYRGMDRFLAYEGPHMLRSFPEKLIYSRLYGMNKERKGPIAHVVDGEIIDYDLFYEPHCSICIFNGIGKKHFGEEAYEGFESYWGEYSKLYPRTRSTKVNYETGGKF